MTPNAGPAVEPNAATVHHWCRATAGNALIAYAGPNGTRSLHEMPATAANAITEADPARNLIIVTWPAEVTP